jgi:hypothetical protein
MGADIGLIVVGKLLLHAGRVRRHPALPGAPQLKPSRSSTPACR